MTFADVSSNQINTRQFFVRLMPGFIGTWTNVSGNLWSTPWVSDLSVPAKFVNQGTELVKDAAYPPATNKWYHDQANELVYLTIATDPNSKVISYRYLFYTDGFARYYYLDPLDANSETVLWEPRIANTPSISQIAQASITDRLSLSSSGISIIDPEMTIKDLIVSGVSFANKQVRIWANVDDEFFKVFDGYSSSVDINLSTAQIEVIDALSLLKAPCFVGDNSNECIVKKTTDSYPNAYSDHIGNSINYIVNRSPHQLETNKAFSTSIGGFSGLPFEAFSIGEQSLKLTCTNYSFATGGSMNRSWVACRTSPSGFKTLNFGTITVATVYGGVPPPEYGYLGAGCADFAVTTSGHNIEVGDSFKVIKSGTTYWCTVTYRTATSFGAMIHNLTGPASNQNWITATFYQNSAPGLVIYDGTNRFLPVYERDFTVSSTLTSGGNYILSITFVNNFETNHVGVDYSLDYLDPSRHQIWFRATEATASTYKSHGGFLKYLLDKAKITTNSASFTASDSSLSANCHFSIPNYGDSSYDSYLTYAEQITKSTLGQLSINNAYEIVYNLLTAPVASSETRGLNEIIKGSYKFDATYRDIVTGITAKNKHVENKAGAGTANTSVRDTVNRYLHDIDNDIDFEHVLEDIDTSGRLQDILDLMSNVDIRERFSTASMDLDTSINDNIQIISSNQRVIGYDKSSSRTQITTSRFGGL